MDTHIRELAASGRLDRAFEAVLERYEDRVFRLAFAILEDRAAAEDAAQEAFVRIWKALPRFRWDAALSTWIYAIARNTALTRLARERRGRAVALDEARARVGPAAQSPELEVFIARLDEKYRRVLYLFYLEEKSYEQVAAALELPIGTVKTHLHRAKKELARIMKEAGYGR